MANLTAHYLGLTLPTPIVVSSNPLCRKPAELQRMEAAGAGAVILPSLFEEQVEIEDLGVQHRREAERAMLPDALQHIPDMEEYNSGVDGYLGMVFEAKRAVNIPVIASLNGVSSRGWVRYARLLEAAGADAIELNVYRMPTYSFTTSARVEDSHAELVRRVKENVAVPVAVKIGPYFSALPHFVEQLAEAGADAVVMFNRFYQPDFDIETETVVSNLQYSTPEELRLRLRWVALLYGQVNIDLAITGGIHSGADAVKALLAGAQVAMVASSLLMRGIDHIATIRTELNQWLERKHHADVAGIIGKLSPQRGQKSETFERANYIQELRSYYDKE